MQHVTFKSGRQMITTSSVPVKSNVISTHNIERVHEENGNENGNANVDNAIITDAAPAARKRGAASRRGR